MSLYGTEWRERGWRKKHKETQKYNNKEFGERRRWKEKQCRKERNGRKEDGKRESIGLKEARKLVTSCVSCEGVTGTLIDTYPLPTRALSEILETP
jgi:hypothetical protein